MANDAISKILQAGAFTRQQAEALLKFHDNITLTSAQIIAALGYTPVPDSRTISAGAGLVGGGNLTADRTLAIDPAVLAAIGNALPLTSSGVTTNAVTGAGHTHQLDGVLPLSSGTATTNSATVPGHTHQIISTTVGAAFLNLTNPSAIRFPRINADNTVSALDAAAFRTAIGAPASTDLGNYVLRAGDTMTGQLLRTIAGMASNTSQLWLRAYSDNAAGEASISYTRGAVSSHGGMNFNVANGAANNVTPLRLTPASGIPVFTTRFHNMPGTVSTQSILRYMGWGDEVNRWAEVMESDATLSLYGYNSSGTGASRLVNMISTHSGLPRLIVDGELAARDASVTPGQIRMVGGNYGAFFRNDGANLYLMLTASGDQYGTWNTLRPLTVSVTTGLVTAGNGLSFGSVTGASNTDLSKHIALYGTSYGFSITGSRLNYVAPNFARHYFMVNGIDAMSVEGANQSGTLTVAGGIWSAGPNSVVHIIDRTSSRQWGWYATSDIFRLWNGSSDIVTFTTAGVATATNWVATSDARLKQDITEAQLYDQLLELAIYDYRWRRSGKRGRSTIAQHVQRLAPAYVHEDPSTGELAVDTGGLALEVAIVALRRASNRG